MKRDVIACLRTPASALGKETTSFRDRPCGYGLRSAWAGGGAVCVAGRVARRVSAGGAVTGATGRVRASARWRPRGEPPRAVAATTARGPTRWPPRTRTGLPIARNVSRSRSPEPASPDPSGRNGLRRIFLGTAGSAAVRCRHLARQGASRWVASWDSRRMSGAVNAVGCGSFEGKGTTSAFLRVITEPVRVPT